MTCLTFLKFGRIMYVCCRALIRNINVIIVDYLMHTMHLPAYHGQTECKHEGGINSSAHERKKRSARAKELKKCKRCEEPTGILAGKIMQRVSKILRVCSMIV